jgi:disulfide bond formation protein DsbB
MFFSFSNTSPRFPILLIILTSLLVLITTFILEHFFEVPICRMCTIERYPYAIAALLGVFLYFFSENTPFYKWGKYLLLIIFIVSLGLSFYHIGLEYEWFQLPSFCQGESAKFDTVKDLRQQILNQKTVIPCNIVPLRLFFLSLAEWNGIASFFLLSISWKLLRKN